MAKPGFRESLRKSGTPAAETPTTEDPPKTFRESLRASTLVAEKADEDVLEALPHAGRWRERAFRESLQDIEDPDVRRQVKASGEQAISKLKDVRGAAKTQRQLAARRGDQATVEKFQLGLSEAMKHEPPEKTAGEKVKTGAQGIFKVLDAPAHFVRQATTKLFGDSEHEFYGKPISGEEWSENVRKTAEQGTGARKWIAKAARLPAQSVGVALGVPLGAATATLGAATDIPGLITNPERKLSHVAEDWRATVGDVRKDVEDVALQTYTDPLSFVGAGVSGASKQAGSTALRGALKAGLTRAEAQALAKQTAKLVQVAGGTERAAPATAKLWRNAFVKAGKTADEGAAAAQKAWGKDLEFLGRGQLELHVPGLSQKSINPIAAATGVDYAGGKLAQKIVDPLLENAGARKLFDPTKQHLKTAQREAKALAETLEREDLTAYKAGLEKLPAGNKLGDAKTREALVEGYLDPAMGPQRPPSTLDPKLGPGAELAAEHTENWFRKQQKALEKANILDPAQIAENPISGQYIPRRYTSRVNTLEDTVQKGLRDRYSEGASITTSRKLATPTELPYAKLEKDPFKIVPAYAKQSARLRAQRSLEDRLVKAYGKEPGMGAGSNLKTTHLNLDGRNVELPADVANVLRGTFNEGISTIGRAARNAGLGSSPGGRALLAVIDAYTGAANRFKGLVLKTPAYHAVNMVDDTVKNMLAGMHNPLDWYRKSQALMRGKPVKVGGRTVTLADANRNKIGLGAASRFERAGVDGVRDLEKSTRTRTRQKEAISKFGEYDPSIADDGGRGVLSQFGDAARELNEAPNKFGDWWENNAKIAHWLWRLDMGDSPQIAARRAFETLIDYSDRSRIEQLLGWFVPFIKYAWASPKSTALAAARNPGAFNVLDRTRQQADEGGFEPRQYISERGPLIQPGKHGQRAIGNIREAFGGANQRKGLSLGVLPRLTAYEAFKPITELASGNPDPLALMLGPLSKAAVEYATEKDLLTKKDLKRPDSPLDLFPPDAPVPARLRASEGENPYASRYLPNFFVSPGTLLGANYAINQATGPAGPIATLGAHRPYTGRQDPADLFAMQFAKYFLGTPLYETTPADPLWNAADQPKVDAAVRTSQSAKKRLKLEREAERRNDRKSK